MRLKIILNNFNEDLFIKLILDKIHTLSSITEDPDFLLSWYNFIMNCALQAGAIVIDSLGNMKSNVKLCKEKYNYYFYQKI